ncbi:MAG: hypothetical protein FWC51_00585 [Proteobacteria bacterium]|nr:hypothetical protein [Pseudomonadota bacterium]
MIRLEGHVEKYPYIFLVGAQNESGQVLDFAQLIRNSYLVEEWLQYYTRDSLVLFDRSVLNRMSKIPYLHSEQYVEQSPYKNMHYAALNENRGITGLVKPSEYGDGGFVEFGNDDPCFNPLTNAVNFYKEKYTNIFVVSRPEFWRAVLTMEQPFTKLDKNWNGPKNNPLLVDMMCVITCSDTKVRVRDGYECDLYAPVPESPQPDMMSLTNDRKKRLYIEDSFDIEDGRYYDGVHQSYCFNCYNDRENAKRKNPIGDHGILANPKESTLYNRVTFQIWSMYGHRTN